MGIQDVTYEGAVAVTASDTVDDPHGPFAGFYAGATGDVKVKTVKGQTTVIPGVPAGKTVPIAIVRVFTTGTASPTTVVGLQQLPWGGK
jgi:hypothetical protein